jgi:hypothetical protein
MNAESNDEGDAMLYKLVNTICLSCPDPASLKRYRLCTSIHLSGISAGKTTNKKRVSYMRERSGRAPLHYPVPAKGCQCHHELLGYMVRDSAFTSPSTGTIAQSTRMIPLGTEESKKMLNLYILPWFFRFFPEFFWFLMNISLRSFFMVQL